MSSLKPAKIFGRGDMLWALPPSNPQLDALVPIFVEPHPDEWMMNNPYSEWPEIYRLTKEDIEQFNISTCHDNYLKGYYIKKGKGKRNQRR